MDWETVYMNGGLHLCIFIPIIYSLENGSGYFKCIPITVVNYGPNWGGNGTDYNFGPSNGSGAPGGGGSTPYGPVSNLVPYDCFETMDDLAKRRLQVFYEEYARYCKALRDDLQSLLEAICAEPNPRFDMVSVKVFMDNYIKNLDASEHNYIKNMVENEIYNYTFCEDHDTVIENLLNTGGCSKAAFDEAWEGMDKIEILDNLFKCGKSLEEECPKLANILAQMTGGDLENPNCGLLKDLADKSTLVRYSRDCNNSYIEARDDGSFPPAQTKSVPESNQISVYFGSEVCDMTCAEILSAVVHESIHAKILSMVYDALIDIFPDASSFSQTDFQEYYFQLRQGNLTLEEFEQQHALFMGVFKELYAQTMYEIVDVGVSSDYYYWAYTHVGLSPQLMVQMGFSPRKNGKLYIKIGMV